MYIDVKITDITLQRFKFSIKILIETKYDPEVINSKASISFYNNNINRRIPIKFISEHISSDNKSIILEYSYDYYLNHIYNDKTINYFNISFGFNYGSVVKDNLIYDISDVEISSDNYFYSIIKSDGLIKLKPNKRRIRKFNKLIGYKIANKELKKKRKNIFKVVYRYLFFFTKKLPIKRNSVLFLSDSRDSLSGNFEFVYKELVKDKSIKIKKFLTRNPKKTSVMYKINKLIAIARSKVILLDDFYPHIYKFKLREQTKIIQLWHACGAFKTFGFSRLGKSGGPKQSSDNHRNYDYAIVSSSNISSMYAEAFGISKEKVISTGVPRTDIFFDHNYKDSIREKLFNEYPILKNKKIILFSPTFRGHGKRTAHYPYDMFRVNELCDYLGDDYFIILKNHPFVKESISIPIEYDDRVIDFSSYREINDLLFITDILITDYSSVIFEAALLDIPMLFYCFDLYEYIASRDFYFDYTSFVPGKICYKFSELAISIKNKDFEEEKIKSFKHEFFDHLDGKSTERVVDMIYKIINTKR